MEDTLFEVEFDQTDEYYKETVRFSILTNPAVIAAVAILALCICAAAVIAVCHAVLGDVKLAVSGGVMTCIMICLTAFALIFIFKKNVSRFINRRKELYGDGKLTCRVSFTENKVKFKNEANSAENVTAISAVARVYDKPGCVIIKTRAKLIQLLPKSGFTKGTPDGLVLFLRSKGAK